MTRTELLLLLERVSTEVVDKFRQEVDVSSWRMKFTRAFQNEVVKSARVLFARTDAPDPDELG